jgi:hypothetical protein
MATKPKKNPTSEVQLNTFHVKINGGPEQQVAVRTGEYGLAAVAALAMLEYPESKKGFDEVEIWAPDLIPEYGPYHYSWDGYTLGVLVKRR